MRRQHSIPNQSARRPWRPAAAAALALLLLLAILLPAGAQVTGYALDWFSVDSGGTVAESPSGYALSGTIGQFDAAPPAAGGTYTLAGGFWPAFPAWFRLNLPIIRRSY